MRLTLFAIAMLIYACEKREEDNKLSNDLTDPFLSSFELPKGSPGSQTIELTGGGGTDLQPIFEQGGTDPKNTFNSPDTLLFASPLSSGHHQGIVYVYDGLMKRFVLINKKGTPVGSRSISQRISTINQNDQLSVRDSLIFLYTGNDKQLRIYDFNFVLLDSFTLGKLVDGYSFAVGGEHIYMFERNLDTARLNTYSLRQPRKFLRTLITLAMNDSTRLLANRVLLSANRSGFICLAFPLVPVLVVFDPSGNVTATLRLRDMDLDTGPKRKSLGFGAVFTRVSQVVDGILLTDQGSILLVSRSKLYVFDNSSNRYIASRQFKLRLKDKKQELSNSLLHLFLNGSNLYVSAPAKNAFYAYSLN